MAESISGLSQAFAFDNNTSTLAAVGGAGAAFPAIFTGSNQNGIDGTTVAEAPDNGPTSLTAGTHYSLWSGNFAASASYDLSAVNSSLSLHFRNLSPGYTVIAQNPDSVWLILFSGSGDTNYGRWEFDGTTLRNGDWHLLTAQGTPDATGGTFDNTDITGVGIAVESDTTGGAYGFQLQVDQCVVHEGDVVFDDTGGAATVDLLGAYDLLKATSGQTYHSNLVKIAGTTVEFGFPFDIQSDDYDDTSTPYGIGFKDGDGVGYKDMPSGFFRLSFTGQASGDQDYGANAVATLSTAYDLTIDASAASTTLDISDRVFSTINDAVITGSGLTLSNVTLVSPATCDISDYAGSLTVNGSVAAIEMSSAIAAGASLTTDSDLLLDFAGADLSDRTFTFTASNTLTLSPTAGSQIYDLSDCSTAGTITLDNDTAFDTTITLPAGTSNTVASPTTGGGAITVDSPATTFTINTNVSALIQIYTNNTQTILDSTTGTSLAFVHTGQTVDYTIQAAGYIPQRFTGETLSGTTSITVNLVADPVYNASHGLTFTTDYSYNANTRVMTIVANQEGRDLYSALIDDFQTETALRNCPFPLTAIGPDRIDFKAVGYYNSATTVGATIDSGDIQFWKGAGMQWEHDTTGNPTKKFYSIKSSNTLVAGSVVGYTQTLAGTPVESTLVSNQVNEVIQFFEDTNGDGTPDYNYTGHLLFKGFQTGYYQARWDVVNDGGVTTLEPYEYNIALTQDAIAGTTGDQSITITTLTDHTSSPITVGGKNFDYELVDPATSTAEDLLAQHNYNVYNAVNTSISGSLYTSYQAFDLPDLIVEAGSNYETAEGYFEGDGAVTDLSGVYLSRSSADHPGIARFQSNDSTYYTPATVAQVSAPNLTVGRVQLVNETGRTASAWAATTAYSLYDKVLRSTGVGTESGVGLFFQCTTAGTSGGSEPTWDTTVGNTTSDGTAVWTCRAIEMENTTTTSGYSFSWTDHEDADSGDTLRLRWVDSDEDEIEATGIATADGTTSFLNTPVDDSVYDGYGIDGSTVTEYSADFPNVEVDVNDPDNIFYIDRFYAWWKYNLTTADGIRNFFGGVTAVDTSNITINSAVVDVFFDNTKAVSARQGDNIVIQRSDGAYPQVATTSGGGGLGFYYTGIGYSTSSGSGLDSTERNKLLGLYDYDPTTNTLEGSMTYQEAQRVMLAESAGQVSVSGSIVTFRDQADTKDRITATVDSNGQRTSVTVDGS